MSGWFDPVLRFNARQRERAQALARPTRERFYITVGVGHTVLAGNDALTFGNYFVDEPTLAIGAFATVYDGTMLPLYSATVLSWVRDTNDLYVGAEVGLRVDSAHAATELRIALAFEASAIKMRP